MSKMLQDLIMHQAWADAELWHAIEENPEARTDIILKKRFHHIHLVQRAFLSIVRGEEIKATEPEDFINMEQLKQYGQEYHDEAVPYIRSISESRLEEQLTIPWFQKPPLRITVHQALMQGIMHSQYHRGQNAARLRELGGNPPLTDFIAWCWKGSPPPDWS